MTNYQREHLSGLIAGASVITNDVQRDFGSLSVRQLNWKPSPDQWSIAQCIDHLATANAAYFPIFEKVVNGEKKNTFWESLPWIPAFWGKMLIQSVAPQAERKLKAPKIFQPELSNLDQAIIPRFINQQNQVIGYMKAAEGLNPEKIIISSPVSNVITYSLIDAYRIIVAHEKRHLLQAERVSKREGFPHP
jgi:hypothetical protein